ncbi:efflux RND transporter periplasmic adaptor subunit [Xanthomonas sp. MUS 060]|uniref:efflux RND transporter periplasmic adaptor subunit n=1 Tax=Xanthomonas sp. MUS 060 TaxID=1588031 RepID=UPI000696F0CC|nr:efflux RND transporter periplasmic adaptor subunit [Xanthomonas sp. MUS 060]
MSLRAVAAAGALLAMGFCLGEVVHRHAVDVVAHMPAHQRGGVAPQALSTRPAISEDVLDATGYAVAVRSATVSSETTGRLVEVLVKEGSMVKLGQVLARLNPHDIDQQIRLAEAQVEASRRVSRQRDIEWQAAEDRFRRMRQLVADRYVSEDTYKAASFEVKRLAALHSAAEGDVLVADRQLSVQRQHLRNMDVVAPFDGLVTERSAQVGEIVSPISAGGGFTRTGICTLVDISSIEVRAKINEKQVGRIHIGQPVVLIPRAYPQMRLSGRVSTIMPVAERETASVEVIVELIERDPRILPNMSVDVAFGRERSVAVKTQGARSATAGERG